MLRTESCVGFIVAMTVCAMNLKILTDTRNSCGRYTWAMIGNSLRQNVHVLTKRLG